MMNEQNQQSYENTETAPGYVMQPDGTYYMAQPAVPKKKKEKKHPGRIFISVMTVCCILFSGLFAFGGTLLANTLSEHGRQKLPTMQQTGENVAVPTIQKGDGLSTAQLAAKVKPSVVEIKTEAMAGNGFISQLVESGAGSGVIWSEDGYIVTNHHVIENASHVSVRLSDGTSYEAKYIGSDAESDLAVIQIDEQNLPAVTLGNSDDLMVGQDVIAVGNPLGELGGTVTNGIVSALDRDVTIGGQTMRLLQTNAAINPGNSGGGLFDAFGNLVGIVNAKSAGDNIEGLGFAIPSTTVVKVANDLIEKGYVSGRINVGLTLMTINDPINAMRYGIEDYGVYVYSVKKESSAAMSGLQPGDRLVKINGTEIADSAQVKDLFTQAGVGSTVEVTVERGDETLTLTLHMTEAVPDELQEHSFRTKYTA